MTGTSTGSEESLRFVRRALRHCDERHALCAASKPASTWYPTRLIDVGLDADAENRPRLVITSKASMDGPYVSLSHCWGRVNPLTLTTGNFDQFLHGIDLTLLPATFLDAFKLTRAIGIRYIWIDSLCIIQNSLNDWVHEAGAMLRVYENAYCNIAATHSHNSSQGLFRSRNPKALFAVLYLTDEVLNGRFEPSHDQGGMEIQYLNGTFELPNHDQWKTDIDDAPLNRRAWVVQERQISKRILHFAADQIYWDCYQSQIGEAFSHRPSGGRLTAKKIQGPLHILDEKKFVHTWDYIIRQYTSSELTFPEKDKIFAISGLAQYLQEVWNIEYCAGLWRKDIEKQLCWTRISQRERNSSKVLRAPSWSWLSYDIAVSLGPIPEMRLFSFVVDVQVQQAIDLAGHQIFRGYLTLRCYLSEITLDEDSVTFITTNQKFSYSKCFIEFDYGDRQYSALFFVPIGMLVRHNFIKGLIVTPSATGSGSYIRLGTGMIELVSRIEDTDLLSTKGKENFPCLEFDEKEGHLIGLE